MKFAVIILHYMVYKDTVECVESIRCLEKDNVSIIIVDNCSPNDSFKILEENYSNVDDIYLIKNSQNLGFAKGFNVGINFANNHLNPTFILCINNDTVITQKDFFNKVAEKYLEYHYWVAGPMIYTRDGMYISNPFRTRIDTLDKIYFIEKALKKERFAVKYHFVWLRTIWRKIKNIRKKKTPVNHCELCMYDQIDVPLHGSCLIFSKDFFSKLKGFNEGTFLYNEENILFEEVMNNHGKTLYTPELRIFHKEDASTDSVTMTARNKRLFQIKNELDSLLVLKAVIEKQEIFRGRNI